jgi:hypothetical protein
MVKHTAHNGQNKGSSPFKSIIKNYIWKNSLIGKALVSKTIFEGSSPSSSV